MRLCKKDMVSAKQWIFDFADHESNISATVLAATCWHIWEARNDARNNAGEPHPLRVRVALKVMFK